MSLYLANDKYRGQLRSVWFYSPADTTISVTAVPENVPTIVTVGWETEYETTFTVAGKSGSSAADYALTGVSVLKGAGLTQNLPENTPVNCLNNEEFFNQYLQTITWVDDTDGATITFDLSESSRHRVTLGGNRTLAISNPSEGQGFIVRLKQDATGSRTVTWFSGISWAYGVTPTLTTTANKADMFTFICTNASTPTFDGFVVGQDL